MPSTGTAEVHPAAAVEVAVHTHLVVHQAVVVQGHPVAPHQAGVQGLPVGLHQEVVQDHHLTAAVQGPHLMAAEQQAV